MKARPIPELTERDQARFWSKVRKTDGCWYWEGSWSERRKRFRYGLFKFYGRNLLPHRVSKVLITGDRPDLEIDHKCRNKLCVNPDHLEWVAPAKNHERRRMPYCRKGHSVMGENARNAHGQCKACMAEYQREYRTRKRETRRAA